MDLLSKLAGVVVVSSCFLSPNYADAQNRQVSSGCYYCQKCNAYHAYSSQRTIRKQGSLGQAIGEGVAENIANAATKDIARDVVRTTKNMGDLTPVIRFFEFMSSWNKPVEKKDKKEEKK